MDDTIYLVKNEFDLTNIDIQKLDVSLVGNLFHQIKSNLYNAGSFLRLSPDTSAHLPPYLESLVSIIGNEAKVFQEELEANEYLHKDALVNLSTSIFTYNQLVREHLTHLPKNLAVKQVGLAYYALRDVEEKICLAVQARDDILPYTSVSSLLDYMQQPLRKNKLGEASSIYLANPEVLVAMPTQETKVVLDNLVNNVYDYSPEDAIISGKQQEDFYVLSVINSIKDESTLSEEVKNKRTGKGLKDNKQLVEHYGGQFTTMITPAQYDLGRDLFMVHMMIPIYTGKDEQK